MPTRVRIPLVLNTVAAVLHRLDVAATRAVDPPGADAAGYDDLWDEPRVYDDAVTSARTSTRRELAAVRVPCQVETFTEQRLRETLGGDAQASNVVLVMHRRDLDRLGLIDATTRDVLIRPRDRISTLERINRPGTVVRTLGPDAAGLHVLEVRGGSWGLGPDGHDLELVFLQDRPQARV